MKRIITAICTWGFASAFSFTIAQTHSDLSGNKPTADNQGYTFDFNGSAANNCLGGGGVANIGGVTNQTWTVTGGQLVVTVPTMTSYNDARQVLKFYKGDCATNNIVLTASGVSLKLKVNSSPANTSTTTSRQLVIIAYNTDGSQTNYNNTPNIITLTTGSNVISTTIDLSGISTANWGAILQLGMFIRGSQWGDYDAAGTYKFDYVAIGNATVPSSITPTTTAGLFFNEDNYSHLVSVYPNPATENISVDMTSLPGSNNVKLINAQGAILSEQNAVGFASFNLNGLSKGMYIVQIFSDNKVVRKKVMVE